MCQRELTMDAAFLEELRCPYSGSRFVLADRVEESPEPYGIVASEAGEFPVIAGVLRLLADDSRSALVELVRQRRLDDALAGALDVPALMGRWRLLDWGWKRLAQHTRLGLAAQTVTPGKRRLFRAMSREHSSFEEVAAAAGADRWTHWQTYRFSMHTFQPVYAFAHLARGARRVLDFGCGLGHSSFLMHRLAPEAEIVCADYSFTSMYLAKRFIVPMAQCVCLDGDFSLPFTEKSFDFIFSTDALQYIHDKVGLAREFRRLLASEGAIALAHLHNRLSPIRAGEALTPEGYDGLFEGMARRVYPERTIVSQYVSEGVLDLTRACSPADLRSAIDGVSLVAGVDESVFVRHEGLIDAYIDAMHRPALNPAYAARPEPPGWTVERRIHQPYASERVLSGCEVLPRTQRVNLQSLQSEHLLESRDGARPTLRELVRRLVVIEIPESYSRLDGAFAG